MEQYLPYIQQQYIRESKQGYLFQFHLIILNGFPIFLINEV